MNRAYLNLPKMSFSFLDLLALNLINLLLLQAFNKLMKTNYDFTLFCIVNNMGWIISSYAAAFYSSRKYQDFDRLFRRTSISLLIFIIIDLPFFFLYSFPYFKLIIISSLLAFSIFLLASRLLLLYTNNYWAYKDQQQQKVIFLGCNLTSRSLIAFFEKSNKPVTISGFFDDNTDINSVNYPILGRIDDCINYAIEHKITEIYSTFSPKIFPKMIQLAKAAEVHLIRFKYIPDLSEYQDCNIDFVNDSPILSLQHEPSESLSSRIKKRMFDILFSSIIIVFVLSWLLPILAIIIKLDSEGPIFFIQKRSGKNNLPFRCIKLRSLTINRDADTVQVSRNDTRITKIGRFLRKSSLDELPQFFNVFFGNMSIVGSRPHMLKHTEEYSKMEDTYMLRHLLKPGVTGWAQINGHRGEIKHKEQLTKRIQHDIWYIENRNVWLDLKIVAATISLTFKGDDNAF